MTRYDALRDSIAYFAAPPGTQVAHDMGADEAVNETPYPLEDMLECGELTTVEVEAIRPLEELIADYCTIDGPKPWHNESLLFSDPNWAAIRVLAAEVLEQLPDTSRR